MLKHISHPRRQKIKYRVQLKDKTDIIIATLITTYLSYTKINLFAVSCTVINILQPFLLNLDMFMIPPSSSLQAPHAMYLISVFDISLA